MLRVHAATPATARRYSLFSNFALRYTILILADRCKLTQSRS
jgi:hypothetical protein